MTSVVKKKKIYITKNKKMLLEAVKKDTDKKTDIKKDGDV